jgi:hypothetical protein
VEIWDRGMTVANRTLPVASIATVSTSNRIGTSPIELTPLTAMFSQSMQPAAVMTGVLFPLEPGCFLQQHLPLALDLQHAMPPGESLSDCAAMGAMEAKDKNNASHAATRPRPQRELYVFPSIPLAESIPLWSNEVFAAAQMCRCANGGVVWSARGRAKTSVDCRETVCLPCGYLSLNSLERYAALRSHGGC